MKEFFVNLVNTANHSSIANIVSSKKNGIADSWLFERTKYLDAACSRSERVYHVVNDLTAPVLCKKCNVSTVGFLSIKKGYLTYCSTKCSKNSDETKAKYKETCIAKYGVENVFQSEDIKEKIKAVIVDRYGVDNVSKSEEIRDKVKATCLEKYGNEDFSKTEQFKQSFNKTCMDRYGVDNPARLQSVKDKIQQSINDRFGTHYMNLPEYKSNINLNGLRDPLVRKRAVYNSILTRLNKKLVTYKEKFHDTVEYIGISSVAHKYRFKCLICSSTFDVYHQYIKYRSAVGKLCPMCYPPTVGKSFREKEVYEFLKSNNLDIIQNSRSIIPPKELDIYIPSLKIAIEFNGIYWHSEQYLDKNYHLDKLEQCKLAGIKLIQIFEDEWVLKQDIVKSRLLHICGIEHTRRIHARQCVIRNITYHEKEEFLTKYHIQGSDISTVYLGAYYGNELVSVMTFSKPNISKGLKPQLDVWELNRFCNSSLYHIPGIASKLLAYFKKTYSYTTIYSYADRRWSIGNVYDKLGFKFDKYTKPNYWYIIDDIRTHRFNFRKDALTKMEYYSPELTEFEIMDLNGIMRVWDCGHIKYIIHNSENKLNKER